MQAPFSAVVESINKEVVPLLATNWSPVTLNSSEGVEVAVPTDDVAAVVITPVPFPTKTAFAVKVDAPVPPLFTARVEVESIFPVSFPIRRSVAVNEATPVPPLLTVKVEVAVNAEVPFPSTISVNVTTPVPPLATVKAVSKVKAPVNLPVDEA